MGKRKRKGIWVKVPPVIEIPKPVLNLDPEWNYSGIQEMATGRLFKVPCCLKTNPCWECA